MYIPLSEVSALPEVGAGSRAHAIGGLIRWLEVYHPIALSTEVVAFIKLQLLDDTDQLGAVGEVTVMQGEARVVLVGILIEVIGLIEVEATNSSLAPVLGALNLQRRLGQIDLVLPGDSGDGGGFCHGLRYHCAWAIEPFALNTRRIVLTSINRSSQNEKLRK